MKKNSKNHTKSKRRHAISVHFEDVVYDDVSKVFRASNVSNFDLVAEEMDEKPAEKLQMSNGDTSEQNDFKGTDYEFWQTKLEQLEQEESHRSVVSKRDTESVNKKKNSFKGLSRDLIAPKGKGPSEYTLKIDNGISCLSEQRTLLWWCQSWRKRRLRMNRVWACGKSPPRSFGEVWKTFRLIRANLGRKSAKDFMGTHFANSDRTSAKGLIGQL